MEASLINLEDFEFSGEGACGKSYNHRIDTSVMAKLYNPGIPVEEVKRELEYALKVYNTGIPTPKPGQFITDGEGRYGLTFERLHGKVSFSRATSQHPERVEEYARRFASMCLELHSIKVDTSKFQNIKERDLELLDADPFLTDDERRRVRNFIANAPDTDTAIHGDLQYSNGLMTDRGDYFIDLGAFAYGHPYFDLGQVMLSCLYSSDDFIRETFHLEPETAREFWHWFAKGYFGDDVSVEEVTRMIEPYSGLMTLFIEKCMQAPMYEFHCHFPK